jgi:flagellar motor protein MotB
MPSLFREAWAEAQPDFDEAFGEEFILLARVRSVTDPDARTTSDSFRPPFPFIGSFTSEGSMAQAQGRGRSGDWTREYVAQPANIKVATVALPDWIASGDQVKRVATNETFIVTSVIPDDLNTSKINLRV